MNYIRKIIRDSLNEGTFGQRPGVELKFSFLNTDFGLQLANKKFGVPEKDIEDKMGRYSKGKYKEMLRGKIVWWKITQGGFQSTGYRKIRRI